MATRVKGRFLEHWKDSRPVVLVVRLSHKEKARLKAMAGVIGESKSTALRICLRWALAQFEGASKNPMTAPPVARRRR